MAAPAPPSDCNTFLRFRSIGAPPGFAAFYVPSCSMPVAPGSAVGSLFGDFLALLHVESSIVDRPAAGGRPRILHEQHLAASLRVQVFLEMRIRIEHHRAWTVMLATNAELAFEDVPDL